MLRNYRAAESTLAFSVASRLRLGSGRPLGGYHVARRFACGRCWEPSANVNRISQLLAARPRDSHVCCAWRRRYRRASSQSPGRSMCMGQHGWSGQCRRSTSTGHEAVAQPSEEGDRGTQELPSPSCAEKESTGYSSGRLLASWPAALTAENSNIIKLTVSDARNLAGSWLDQHKVVDPYPSASELLAKAAGFRSPQDMLIKRPMSFAAGLSQAEWNTFRELCRKRAEENVPVQYLVGEWDFHRISLEMEPPTLIPRPETEELVEMVLEWLHKEGLDTPLADRSGERRKGLRILDVGSGTGAIGLALLKQLPVDARCVAIDVQEAAVRLSRRNAERTGLAGRYECVHADIASFANIIDNDDGTEANSSTTSNGGGGGNNKDSTTSSISSNEFDNDLSFDFIVSNPPYIPQRDMADLPADVAKHEDNAALNGGEDGLDVVREIVRRSPRLLRRGGPRQLWMEVDTSHPRVMQNWLGLGLGVDGVLGKGTEQQGDKQNGLHGVTTFEWRSDMFRRPRFVRLTFADEE